MGAAHADHQLRDRERAAVHALLSTLTGAPLTADLAARVAGFDPARFDLAATAAAFRGDPEADRRRLLVLVAAVHDSDAELDFAEDAFLRALGAALELPADALEGLTIDVEPAAMRESLRHLRRLPPPPPRPGTDG